MDNKNQQYSLVQEVEFPVPSIEDWVSEAKKQLGKKFPFREINIFDYLSRESVSGISTKGYYTKQDYSSNYSMGSFCKKNVVPYYEGNFDFIVVVNSIDKGLSLKLLENKEGLSSKGEGNLYVKISLQEIDRYLVNPLTENALILSLISNFIEEKYEQSEELSEKKLIFQCEKNIGVEFFTEIAAIYALKLGFSYITNRFGIEDAELQIVAKPNLLYFSKLDYYSNIIRLSLMNLAALLSEVSYIKNISFDLGVEDKSTFNIDYIDLIGYESKIQLGVNYLKSSFFLENLIYEFTNQAVSKLSDFYNDNLVNYIQSSKFFEMLKFEQSHHYKKIRMGTVSFVGVNKSHNNLSEKNDILIKSVQDKLVPKEDISRFSENFEILNSYFRTQVNHYMYLACLGEKINYVTRLDYSLDFLGVLGLNNKVSGEFEMVDDVVNTCVVENPPIIGLCATDKTYNESLRALIMALSNSLPFTKVVVFGNPKKIDNYKDLEKFKNLDFIYKGVDIIQMGQKIDNSITDFYNTNLAEEQ